MQSIDSENFTSLNDEFEVSGEHAETVSMIVKEEMEAAGREYLKSLPVIAEVTVGDVWQK